MEPRSDALPSAVPAGGPGKSAFASRLNSPRPLIAGGAGLHDRASV